MAPTYWVDVKAAVVLEDGIWSGEVEPTPNDRLGILLMLGEKFGLVKLGLCKGSGSCPIRAGNVTPSVL